MKFRAAIAVASLAVFGLAHAADARPSHLKRHVAKKVIKRQSPGGVRTSTSDVNGDGVPDVVVAPKPKRRPSGGSSGGVSVSQ